jgi:hypothetical protein
MRHAPTPVVIASGAKQSGVARGSSDWDRFAAQGRPSQ